MREPSAVLVVELRRVDPDGTVTTVAVSSDPRLVERVREAWIRLLSGEEEDGPPRPDGVVA